jgi:hypothetical protein
VSHERKPRLSEVSLQPGATVEIKCVGCSRWFTWTVTDEHGPWYDNVPAFHSRKCRERRRERLRDEFPDLAPCPHPEKRVYDSQADAEVVRRSLTRQYREPFSILRCVCGNWHIGRTAMRKPTPVGTGHQSIVRAAC